MVTVLASPGLFSSFVVVVLYVAWKTECNCLDFIVYKRPQGSLKEIVILSWHTHLLIMVIAIQGSLQT